MPWVLILLMTIQSFSPGNADAFADKMEEYYGFNLRWEKRYIGTWMGATVYGNNGCTDRVYLSDQFYGELGDDDLWKGILAHEWAHVSQGSQCANNEHDADLIALEMLWNAKEFSAYFRYAKFLQEQWGWEPEECYARR